jgi:hypothetical protein
MAPSILASSFVYILLSLVCPSRTLAQLKYPCIKLCLQWNDANGIDLNTPLDQNAEYKLALEPEVSCPTWMSSDVWDTMDADKLNSQVCELG